MSEQPLTAQPWTEPPLYVLSDEQVERVVALLLLARCSRSAREDPGAEPRGLSGGGGAT